MSFCCQLRVISTWDVRDGIILRSIVLGDSFSTDQWTDRFMNIPPKRVHYLVNRPRYLVPDELVPETMHGGLAQFDLLEETGLGYHQEVEVHGAPFAPFVHTLAHHSGASTPKGE
jgi:hypothetical protein